MTKLVGILNVTPDSFSDGGRFTTVNTALRQAEELFAAGAAFIDVGAESTRPGAEPLSAEQEWQRLEAILNSLIRAYSGKVSVDTYHPETAAKALALAPVTINDVTGMADPAMVELIISNQARIIISHLPGKDIQAAHRGKLIDDIVVVQNDLLKRAALLQSKGLPKANIILDPGIGFGKTPELNWQLLEFAALVPEYPVMIGYSRKRFLGERRLELATNLAAGRKAIAAGAAYLRVHDVAGHRALIK